jgi:hypothetical protein
MSACIGEGFARPVTSTQVSTAGYRRSAIVQAMM